MIKLHVNFSKKVPGASDFSSDGFMASLEMEASDSVVNSPSELRAKLSWLWAEVRRTVDEQIAQGNTARQPVSAPTAPPAPSPARQPEPAPQNGDGPATSRQVKFIISLGQRDHNMTLAELAIYLGKLVGQEDVHKLTKAQASKAIEDLTGKRGQP